MDNRRQPDHTTSPTDSSTYDPSAYWVDGAAGAAGTDSRNLTGTQPVPSRRRRSRWRSPRTLGPVPAPLVTTRPPAWTTIRRRRALPHSSRRCGGKPPGSLRTPATTGRPPSTFPPSPPEGMSRTDTPPGPTGTPSLTPARTPRRTVDGPTGNPTAGGTPPSGTTGGTTVRPTGDPMASGGRATRTREPVDEVETVPWVTRRGSPGPLPQPARRGVADLAPSG